MLCGRQSWLLVGFCMHAKHPNNVFRSTASGPSKPSDPRRARLTYVRPSHPGRGRCVAWPGHVGAAPLHNRRARPRAADTQPVTVSVVAAAASNRPTSCCCCCRAVCTEKALLNGAQQKKGTGHSKRYRAGTGAASFCSRPSFSVQALLHLRIDNG